MKMKGVRGFTTSNGKCTKRRDESKVKADGGEEWGVGGGEGHYSQLIPENSQGRDGERRRV